MIHILNKRDALSNGAFFVETTDEGVRIPPTRVFYVGRPTVLGNPYSHLSHGTYESHVETREEAVAKYKLWLNECYRMSGGGRNKAWNEVLKIAAKIKAEPNEDWGLMCWCAPLACHAEAIKQAIEWAIQKGKV